MSKADVRCAGLFDPEAFFNRVYAEHHQAVHAFFLGRAGDAETALDLLQETFLRVWRNLSSLREVPPARRRYWLFTVARNVLTDDYRKRATRSSAEEKLVQEHSLVAAPAPSSDERLVDVETLEQLDRAIGRLPEDLRTVLVMQVVGGMKSTQIGEALDRPAGTVRYQVFQARKRLAQELQLSEDGVLEEVNRL